MYICLIYAQYSQGSSCVILCFINQALKSVSGRRALIKYQDSSGPDEINKDLSFRYLWRIIHYKYVFVELWIRLEHFSDSPLKILQGQISANVLPILEAECE